jgi:hypothetical protein
VRGRFTGAYTQQDESPQEVQEKDGIRCVYSLPGFVLVSDLYRTPLPPNRVQCNLVE